MEPSVVMSLVNLGAAGAVILALVLVGKVKIDGDKASAESKAKADEHILDRLDKIVDRHLASEEAARAQIYELSEASRAQIRDLSETNRNLFDRVITVCTGLGGAIQELSTNTRANEKALLELSASTKANEKAIQDLRNEFRSLGAPEIRKALGHDEPPPFVAR